jgi:hypothetical protein
MTAQVLEIQAVGFKEASHRMGRIAVRFVHAEPAFLEMAEIIQHGEERVFATLHGKYVRTGALKESLTKDHAEHAIRRAHAEELEFGSGLPYAIYQRKNKRAKSAVLKLLTKERREVGQLFLGYVVRGDHP